MHDQVYGYNGWCEATWIPRRLAERCLYCDAWHVAGCFCGCPTGKRLWRAHQRYTSGQLSEGADEQQRITFARWLYDHHRLGADDRDPDPDAGERIPPVRPAASEPLRPAEPLDDWDESAWIPD